MLHNKLQHGFIKRWGVEDLHRVRRPRNHHQLSSRYAVRHRVRGAAITAGASIPTQDQRGRGYTLRILASEARIRLHLSSGDVGDKHVVDLRGQRVAGRNEVCERLYGALRISTRERLLKGGPEV